MYKNMTVVMHFEMYLSVLSSTEDDRPPELRLWKADRRNLCEFGRIISKRKKN